MPLLERFLRSAFRVERIDLVRFGCYILKLVRLFVISRLPSWLFIAQEA
jgi:hypothetical protein